VTARSLVYSSYLGGSNREAMYGVISDRNGAGWFIGSSQSNDFPLKKPLQPRSGGGQDAVIVKLSPIGEMLFSDRAVTFAHRMDEAVAPLAASSALVRLQDFLN
jgi:hypothetical protein